MDQETKNSTLSTRSCDLSVCSECNGTGWVIYSRHDKAYGDILIDYAEPCPSCNGGLSERAEAMRRSSDIPAVFYDKKYESFNWNVYRGSNGAVIDLNNTRTIVENLLRNYHEWKRNGMGLYIHSQTKGSGKTFLACCICNELMERYGIRTKFVRASDLLNIAQSADKESYNEYERDPIKLLCNCELLMIDDIGQKNCGGGWMDDIMFRIVDGRTSQGLVSIFTSNLNLDANQLRLDDRIISRMNKTTLNIPLPEFDVRQREAYNNKSMFLKKMGLSKGGG